LTTYIPLKELGHTKEKTFNIQQRNIVGHTLTIGQFISMLPAPQKPQIAQQMMTWLESKKYWKEQKLLFLWQFKNSKQLADQLAPPYRHKHLTPEPQYKQVCFLLHQYPKENNQPQYYPEPELLLPVPRHPKPAHHKDLYKLHHLVLQQLYEPEPAGAEPARAGLGSSSSRAEPWGAGSKWLSRHRPLTGSWPVPLSSLHTALLFGYFSAHLFSILYQITTFY